MKHDCLEQKAKVFSKWFMTRCFYQMLFRFTYNCSWLHGLTYDKCAYNQYL